MIFRKDPLISKNERGWLSQGGHITEVWETPDGQHIAIGYVGRPDDDDPYFVGKDYRPYEGYWSSGVYGFRSEKQARKYVTQNYGKDIRRVDIYPERSYRDLY